MAVNMYSTIRDGISGIVTHPIPENMISPVKFRNMLTSNGVSGLIESAIVNFRQFGTKFIFVLRIKSLWDHRNPIFR